MLQDLCNLVKYLSQSSNKFPSRLDKDAMNTTSPRRKPQKVETSKQSRKRSSLRHGLDEENIYQEPIKQIVKPSTQLNLNEQELNTELTRVLTATDPNVPSNITKYNYKDRMYKIDPPGPGDHLAVHFSMDGSILLKGSNEAQRQLTRIEKKREELEAQKRIAQNDQIDNFDLDGGAKELESSSKNQFNYSERSAQMLVQPMKDRGISTEPTPLIKFSSTVAQWKIYDKYMRNYSESKQVDNPDLPKTGYNQLEPNENETFLKKNNTTGVSNKSEEDELMDSDSMKGILKMLERMASQNAGDELFQDFKYWEDASDPYKDKEGSLLPLWKFTSDRTKKMQVTALCWNYRYPDLFAVAYGSYDFLRQGGGMVGCFSLKNTRYPEYSFSTESGVLCIDFHPTHHSLMAIGCYDGTVMVFDIKYKASEAIYCSSITTGKHADPVWQVHWQQDDPPKELNFFSVSSDGRVSNWILSKNELKMEPIIQLKLVSSVKEELEMSVNGLAGGCCFDFNGPTEELFVVGTEEGRIHKCSKAYTGQYLSTYEGHSMTIYALHWSPFHPQIFLSCSADWTVKLWDHNQSQSIMSFDLGNQVGDVCWSPYSSTVFAAVTSDGKVHVFDLAQNKHEAICQQKVTKRSRLTHVCFNLKDPIVIVGDDKGGVESFKLSPNLRKVHRPAETEDTPQAIKKAEMEILRKIISAADSHATEK